MLRNRTSSPDPVVTSAGRYDRTSSPNPVVTLARRRDRGGQGATVASVCGSGIGSPWSAARVAA
jgi:hypothetical protein